MGLIVSKKLPLYLALAGVGSDSWNVYLLYVKIFIYLASKLNDNILIHHKIKPKKQAYQ